MTDHVRAGIYRLQLFRSINDRLHTITGQHRRPKWWDGHGERFYLHPTATRGIFRVGRGGNKSTEGRGFALTEMLSPWAIPANERHYFAWVSENVEEANQRPRQIETDLRALGIQCTRSGNTVDIDGMSIGFKSFACRVGAVSGFRCIGFVCDEEAKWQSETTKSNPAPEVVASLRAMCITHPEAREWHISSAWTTEDFHAEQFGRGDTEFQIVAYAPSWIANPDAITEEQTRKVERDERVWSREYLGIPNDGAIVGNWFGEAAIQNAIDRGRVAPEPFQVGIRYWLSLDQSSHVDPYGWCVLTNQVGEWNAAAGTRAPRIVRVQECGAWLPDRDGREMADRFRREVCMRYSESRILIDNYAGEHYAVFCRDVGLKPTIIKWTSGSTNDESKTARFKAVRMNMSSGTFKIPDDPDLIREMRTVRGVLTPSGNEIIEIPRTPQGHGDRVSAMVLAGSEALLARPQLAPGRMTWWEKRERLRRQSTFLGAAGNDFGIGSDPNDIPSTEELREMAANGELPKID